MRHMVVVAVAVAALVLGGPWSALAAETGGPSVDAIMGAYEGTFTPASGSPGNATAQVVAEFTVNKDKSVRKTYRALLSTLAEGGAQPVKAELIGDLAGGQVALAGKGAAAGSKGLIANEKLAAEIQGDNGGKFELKHILRHSPIEGQKPPEGAVVLLPYEPGKPTNLDAWRNKTWKILDDGSIQMGKRNNLTVQEFGDVKLHLEFKCPYMPEARGQGRGNSGVYSQDRYEVQILDSFGLPPKDNECGGIYQVATPKLNACFPPESWQTYDIEFHTHRFDADGKVLGPATLTVRHNGVLIHDNVEVMKETVAAGSKGAVKTGPLMIQDHGNPVCYRNIWLVELNK